MTRRYPFEPLATAMRETPARAARLLRVSGSTWKEYRERGMTERVADRLAVRAGLNPYVVWPEMLDVSILETETERRARLAAKERRRYQTDGRVRELRRAASQRYHAEHGDYLNAQRRARYRRHQERERAARRERYRRQRGAAA